MYVRSDRAELFPPLASGKIDRDAHTRNDAERLRAAWQEANARVLPLHGLTIPIQRHSSGAVSLSLEQPEGDYSEIGTDRPGTGHIFLGRNGGDPIFGQVLDDSEVSQREAWEWVHPFSVAMDLNENERELLTIAQALMRWHEAAEFSPRDGKSTRSTLGGWVRLDEHGGEHFPRTDPAVIVLVEHNDRVLLGSNVLWESGRFSILAGFVEAGESLEQAVAREVFEESGMRLGNIRYVTSQPWPFPRSLMVGFRAELEPGVDPEALVPDPTEISELRWFSRDEIERPAPGVVLPQQVSIARWLIDQWVAEGDGTPAK